jgi:structural maintenance of chromosomes protein 5
MQKYDNDKEKLASLNKKQEADRVDVERYRQQENLSTQIEDLKIRIPFAKFRVARAAAAEKKVELQEARRHVRDLEGRDAPMHKRVKNYEARKGEFERRKEGQKTVFERVLKNIATQGKEAQGYEAKANELRAKMTRIRKAKADRVLKIRAKEKDLEKDERHLAKCEQEFNNLPENWEADVQV